MGPEKDKIGVYQDGEDQNGKDLESGLALDILNIRCLVNIQIKIFNSYLDICVSSRRKFKLNGYIAGV